MPEGNSTVHDLPMQTREASLVPATYNAETSTIDLVWSTGAPVRRYSWVRGEWYDEVLVLAGKAVDLSRLNAGASFLNSHDAYDLNSVLGSVVPGSARIEKGQGVATVLLSQRPDLAPIIGDIKAGIIRNISVGYNVRRYLIDEKEGEIPVYRAVDWLPMEISAVAIPADAGAQTRDHSKGNAPCHFESRADAAHNPEQQETSMPEPTNQAAETRTAGTVTTETATVETRANPVSTVDVDAVRRESVAAERARIAEIRSASSVARMDEAFVQRHVDGGTPMDQVRKAILDEMAKRSSETEISGQNAVLTDDPTAQHRTAVENALLHKHAPGEHKLTEHGREYRGMNLLEIGKDLLEKRGVKTRGMSKMEAAGFILGLETRAGAMGTSDFPAILANVANKTLRAAYESTPQTFKPISRQASASDFKPISRTQLSGAPKLELVNENGEFHRGSLSDAKETYALGTYGKIVPFTRQSIINDDLGAFTRIPALFGSAAADLESDVVWAIITTNANMGDGNALFSTAHANYTSSGTALSIDSLSVGRAAMRQQTGLEGRLINILAKTLVVPTAKETLAQQLCASTNVIYTKATDQNPFANTLQPIPEPRLDASSVTAWYLFGSPGQIDTVEYAYLDGSEGVQLSTRIGFDIDGVEIKCALDFAAKALDWRGMYKNAGA